MKQVLVAVCACTVYTIITTTVVFELIVGSHNTCSCWCTANHSCSCQHFANQQVTNRAGRPVSSIVAETLQLTFKQQCFHEKACRDASCLLLSLLTLVRVLFHPTYSCNFLVAFYTCLVYFFSEWAINTTYTGILILFIISAKMLWGVAQSMGVVSKLHSQSKAALALKRKIITRRLGHR